MGTNSMCGDVDRWSEEVPQRSTVSSAPLPASVMAVQSPSCKPQSYFLPGLQR